MKEIHGYKTGMKLGNEWEREECQKKKKKACPIADDTDFPFSVQNL